MVSARNPFKPTAGATPPLLVGRQDDLDEFEESIDDGPGAPARLAFFTGARGTGKTVMLSEVADRVLRRGWVTIHDSATPGLIDRLTRAVTTHLHELDSLRAPRRQVTGLQAGGVGITLAESPGLSTTWRTQVAALLDTLERRSTGLLITIDEIHAAGREELRELTTNHQHLIRDDRDVALAMAGLPSAVSGLLKDDVLTFLRRAHRFDLTDVPLDAVRDAFRTTIGRSGRSITETALADAAAATSGFPFMIQLVGYHIWRRARNGTIDQGVVAEALPVARRRLGSTVHATSLADLSDVDRTFLLAMSHDDGASSVSELRERLQVNPQYINTYRSRLLAAGMIETTRRGYVDFTMPFLREYLREHAAHYR